MAKILKFVPKKETPSSSKPSENDATEEPPMRSYIPTGFPTMSDFKVDYTPMGREMFINHRPSHASEVSLNRLRDEFEKEEDSELVARVRSDSKMPRVVEAVEETMVEVSKRVEINLDRSSEVEKENVTGTSSFYDKRGPLSDDESDSVANKPNSHVHNKFDVIEQLRGEMDVVKAKIEEWKKNMDRLASEKETARTQFASAEIQLRAAKEMNLAQAKMIEELQSQLSSVVSGQENLAKELKAAKSEVITARNETDKNVAQLKVDVEAIQEQAKNMVKHARWESRRETFEGVHAQNLDILTEIENAKTCETNARRLAFLEEDSEASAELGEYGVKEKPVGDDVSLDED
ncbi:uncharacterized protein [Nicotiana tomentosiformis]|uniref:uncharacterized protein n=1 Tax=Nicotiana tomentosiformis TaxID=4098 RepID=UPI00388CA60E